MLGLMSADDTLLLLAAMSDTSRKLVAGKLTQVGVSAQGDAEAGSGERQVTGGRGELK